MIKYLEKNFYDEIKDKKILVDFYADWCGPCKMLGKVLENIDEIDILKVNVDKFSDVARDFGVMSIPTIILFNNNEAIKTNIGFLNEDEIKQFIKM